MFPRHSLDNILSPFSVFLLLSICISFTCSLSLSFFLSLFYILSTRLMLFQVFHMYSITTNNEYLSGDISCSMLCLLALFIAYTALTTALFSPLPPLDVFSCPDSALFLLLMSFRLFLKSHSGTAGRQSSLVIHGADFSTKDMDNDNCMCKCALMLTGGRSNYTERLQSFMAKQKT